MRNVLLAVVAVALMSGGLRAAEETKYGAGVTLSWGSAQLADAVRREFPALAARVLLIAPAGGDAAVENFCEQHGLLMMCTPFALPDLVAMTRLLLNRGRRAGREAGEPAMVR